MEAHENSQEPKAVTEPTAPIETPTVEELVVTVEEEQVDIVKPAKAQTKDEIFALLTALLEKEGKDITREEIARLKQAYHNIHRSETEEKKSKHIEAGGTEEDFQEPVDELEQKLTELIAKIKQKKAEWVEERERVRKENLEKKSEIIKLITELAADTDNVNRTYSRFKELTQQFRETGDVPQENATEIWKKFQDAEQLFYDQLKINQELRDYDFRKNLEIKKSLIEKAEELAAKFTNEAENAAEEVKQEIVEAFRLLQGLHDQWKLTGPIAKELRDEVWQKFKDATAVINKQYQTFFEQRKANEKANEAAKEELCEKVGQIDLEALKTAKDWEKATQQVIELQAQWKAVGYAPRKTNNALYSRFRKSCDDFFKKKGEFFAELKASQSENLEKKTALAVRAEELRDSTDWNATAAELTKLQNEWKKIGAIPRKQSDALWERFHSACDTFFNNRKEALSGARQQEKANLKAKEEIIRRLAELLEADDKEKVREELAELQKQWREIGFVPFRDKNRVADAYREAVNNLRKAFNLSEARASFEKFQSSLDDISSDRGKLNRERDRLFRQLEAKRSDLINYQNNLGFFTSKSKKGDGLLKEIEHKIELIKADIADLEQRITLIDSKMD